MKVEISYFLISEDGKDIIDPQGKNVGNIIWLAEGLSKEGYQNIKSAEERKIYSAEEGKMLHNKETGDDFTGKVWIEDSDLDNWEEVEEIESDEPEVIEDPDTHEMIIINKGE